MSLGGVGFATNMAKGNSKVGRLLSSTVSIALAAAAMTAGCVIKEDTSDADNKNRGGTNAASTGGGVNIAGSQPIASGGTSAGATTGTATATGGSSLGGTSTVANVAGAAGTGVGAAVSDLCAGVDPGNETRETATVQGLGASFLACLQTASDVDFYEFTTPANPLAGGVVKVGIVDVGTTGAISSKVYVAADNGLLLEANEERVGTNVNLWFSAVPATTYRVSVQRHSLSPKSQATAYTFKTEYVPVVDTYEPNNYSTDAAAIEVGAPVKGFFFAGNSVSTGIESTAWDDWYKVTLAVGTVTITLDNVADGILGSIRLLDSLRSEVAKVNSATRGAGVVLTHELATPGVYYVGIAHGSLSDDPAKGLGVTSAQYTTLPYSLTVSQ